MKNNNPVTLVGAGLVGSLLAIYLVRRGFDVRLFERRPDMRKEKISAGRSINLAISTRGLHALREVSLEEVILKQAVPMKGRMIHSITGEPHFQRYGKDDSECIYSISRAGLNQVLMTEAERGGKLKIHFHERAVSSDIDNCTAEFQNELTGALSRYQAQVLIGTDGSSSVLRHTLMQKMDCSASESLLEHGYKELIMPASSSGSSRFVLEKNALHIWPRGTYMLIALPNFDGSFTCTLFLPFHGPLSFESLRTPEAVMTFFQSQFPDAVPYLPNLTEEFFENPTGSMVTVKCSPWHWKKNAFLLGDAAHAIVPFFGQGMNCGFEDCSVFNQCLEKYTAKKYFEKLDWEALFLEVNQLRKPNADAIADMAVENFVEMRDKVANPQFLLEKAVEKILEAQFPKNYISRYCLVTFSRVPYQIAYQAGIVQNNILKELCKGIDSAEQVNLKRAAELIDSKLSPILKEAKWI